MRRMHIYQDQLDYVGLLTVPMYHLFTSTPAVASGLYYAFLGLHSGTESITVDADPAQLPQMTCAVTLGQWGTWRLSLERVDWTLPHASSWKLDSAVLARGDTWLRTAVRGPLLRNHYFTYTAHLFAAEGTAHDVLASLGTPALENLGESYGTGAIYHVFLASHRWTVQITVDHSQQFTGGIFFQVIAAMEQDAVDYTQVGVDLYALVRQVLITTGMDVEMSVG
jgi:hypothetical protein